MDLVDILLVKDLLESDFLSICANPHVLVALIVMFTLLATYFEMLVDSANFANWLDVFSQSNRPIDIHTVGLSKSIAKEIKRKFISR